MHGSCWLYSMEYIQHIFLADDDPDDRVLFYEAIRITAPQAHISLAGNGSELVDQLLESIRSDWRMVFLDINMPVQNGHECLQQIRNHPLLCTLPVFIYSTSENPADIDLAYTIGADYYIYKPSSFNYLLDMVRGIFSLNRWVHQRPARNEFVLRSVAGA